MPAAERIGDPRPSAATTRRALTVEPSESDTRASEVRVKRPVVAVPGRKLTLGSSASRATSSRRNSQLGRLWPKG